ncbi:Uncharacterized protein Fot_42402 [Forsythia ovata]|uniref:Uncharacterized protein n=1 Tax=Forsythia ovata TaxID=205694 RepID=A0ABD1RL20_9LAMI
MDKGSRPQAEPTIDNNMIIDIGFGDLYEGSGLNSDTDYRNLDDLDNLDSKRELPSRRRTRDFKFNHRVDIVNPQFKTSDMMFGSFAREQIIDRVRFEASVSSEIKKAYDVSTIKMGLSGKGNYKE